MDLAQNGQNPRTNGWEPCQGNPNFPFAEVAEQCPLIESSGDPDLTTFVNEDRFAYAQKHGNCLRFARPAEAKPEARGQRPGDGKLV